MGFPRIPFFAKFIQLFADTASYEFNVHFLGDDSTEPRLKSPQVNVFIGFLQWLGHPNFRSWALS